MRSVVGIVCGAVLSVTAITMAQPIAYWWAWAGSRPLFVRDCAPSIHTPYLRRSLYTRSSDNWPMIQDLGLGQYSPELVSKDADLDAICPKGVTP